MGRWPIWRRASDAIELDQVILDSKLSVDLLGCAIPANIAESDGAGDCARVIQDQGDRRFASFTGNRIHNSVGELIGF